MKKYNFKNNSKIKGIKVIAITQAVTLMLSGCLQKDIDNNGSNIEDEVLNTSIESTTESEVSETTAEIVYDFKWGKQENEEFDQYVIDRFNVESLRSYVYNFGFTSELNDAYIDYVNQHYGTNYEYVPFSKAKYFRSQVSNTDYDYYHKHRDYDVFCNSYLDVYLWNGAFNNRVVISYLIQNNIPFGTMVPIENLKEFYGDTFYDKCNAECLLAHCEIGTEGPGYVYNAEELFYALLWYNNTISSFCFTEGNPTRDLNTTDPEFIDVCNETKEIFNPFLVQKFGEGCIQFDQVPTEETYQVMFPGEKIIDFSNIPGAIMNDVQVKGSARVNYTDRLDNYTLYNYDDSYYTVEEQPVGRTR